MFDGTAKQLVPDVVNGANACVFAYGATGSGKTYTMMGSDHSPGVVLLTTDALFDAVSAASEEHAAAVTMQYVEIYNEHIQVRAEEEAAARTRSGGETHTHTLGG